MEEEGEEDLVGLEEEEYVAVFLGHTLTPPLVEATIMVSVSDKKENLKLSVLFSTLLQLLGPLMNSSKHARMLVWDRFSLT